MLIQKFHAMFSKIKKNAFAYLRRNGVPVTVPNMLPVPVIFGPLVFWSQVVTRQPNFQFSPEYFIRGSYFGPFNRNVTISWSRKKNNDFCQNRRPARTCARGNTVTRVTVRSIIIPVSMDLSEQSVVFPTTQKTRHKRTRRAGGSFFFFTPMFLYFFFFFFLGPVFVSANKAGGGGGRRIDDGFRNRPVNV